MTRYFHRNAEGRIEEVESYLYLAILEGMEKYRENHEGCAVWRLQAGPMCPKCGQDGGYKVQTVAQVPSGGLLYCHGCRTVYDPAGPAYLNP